MTTARAPLGKLYLVATPRPHMTEPEFLARIEAAIAGGVDVVQLRCKDLEARAYLGLAERVGELARAAGIPFIVNDRADVALAAGADGVHLGQNDLPLEWATRVVPGRIVGRSSHEAAQAVQAVAEGASYFAVGPVWATPTKPGRPAAGLSYVRDVAARGISIPWFAIGGITLDNVIEVLDAGATRVALVRAILDAPDPTVAARGFVDALGATRNDRAAEGAMYVNGERYARRPGLTLHALLADLGVERHRVVVMHGDEIHRTTAIPDVPVRESDVIEIVTMMQGG